jgi:hypothetical protein
MTNGRQRRPQRLARPDTCDRAEPRRLIDRMLRLAGWHCASCWRAEREPAGEATTDSARHMTVTVATSGHRTT